MKRRELKRIEDRIEYIDEDGDIRFSKLPGTYPREIILDCKTKKGGIGWDALVG